MEALMDTQAGEARAALSRLGYGEGVGAMDVLAGGASGAASYRVALPGGPAVLKLVTAEADAVQRQRAAREAAFYHELAPRLSVRTPAVLASAAEPDGSRALLLRAYGPPRTLHELSDGDMAAVVAMLVGLHAAFWGQADLVQRYAWLGHGPAPDSAGEFEHAVQMWHTQAAYAPLQGAISAETLAALSQWYAVLQAAERRLAGYPVTLIHGDCHLGNVLWAADGPVWADWQEVSVGVGPSDMSFLLQRACGPQDDAVYQRWAERYAEALAEAAPTHPEPALTLQVLDATELRVRLLAWPHYFDWLPREAVAHQAVRLALVAERLTSG